MTAAGLEFLHQVDLSPFLVKEELQRDSDFSDLTRSSVNFVSLFPM